MAGAGSPVFCFLSFPETNADYSPHLVAEHKMFALHARDAMPTPTVDQIAAQMLLLVADAEIVNITVRVEEMMLDAIENECLQITGDAKRTAARLGNYGGLYQPTTGDQRLSGHRQHHHFTTSSKSGACEYSLPTLGKGSTGAP